LLARTTLQQQDIVVVADVEQLFDEGDRLVVNGFIDLTAMAVLHHAHAAAVDVEQLPLRAFESAQGKSCGACIEIDYSSHIPPRGQKPARVS